MISTFIWIVTNSFKFNLNINLVRKYFIIIERIVQKMVRLQIIILS